MRASPPPPILVASLVLMAGLLGALPEARAQQRLAGGPGLDPGVASCEDYPQAIESENDWCADCAVVLPSDTIAQFLAERIGGNTTFWTDYTLGGNHSTSNDDIIEVGATRFVGGILAAQLTVRIRLRATPPLDSFVQQYACPDQPVPNIYPNIWVTYLDLYTTPLAPVPPDDGHLRCEVQREFQEYASLLSSALEVMYVLFGGKEEMLSTFIIPTRDLAWRIVGSSGGVFMVRQELSKPAWRDFAESMGVRVACEHRGADCRRLLPHLPGQAAVMLLEDTDRDGHCDENDVCLLCDEQAECTHVFNYTNGYADLDMDGIPDPCDNCPPVAVTDSNGDAIFHSGWNPDQRDYPDGDLIGNACDDDKDNDVIKDIYDCDDLNAYIGLDADQDGHCDLVDDEWECWQMCQAVPSLGEWDTWLGWEYAFQYQSDCQDRCDGRALDNCADRGPPDSLTDACRQAGVDMQGGGGPGQAGELCSDLYGNQDQENRSPDAVGDKCESRARHLTFEPSTLVSGTLGEIPYYGDQVCRAPSGYRVSFTGNAATVAQEGSEPHPHLGVSVESCHCSQLTPHGKWVDEDVCEDRCRSLERAPWNPVRAEPFGPGGPHLYGDLGDQGSIRHSFLVDNRMARDRIFPFRRDPRQNQFSFQWRWQSTVQYPYDSEGIADFSVPPEVELADLAHTPADPKGQRVRVSWPVDTRPDGETVHWEAEDWNVLLSDEVHKFQKSGWCLDIILGGLLFQSRRVGLPGVQAAQEQVWALFPDEAGGEHLLAGFGRSLAAAQRLEPLSFPVWETSRPALMSAALTAGQIDGGLLGEEPGKMPAIFALDGDTLWIGAIRQEGNLWQRADSTLGIEPLPALYEPRLAFDERQRRLYILGDETGLVIGDVIGERNVLHAIDLETGSVRRLGPVPALRSLVGFSLSYDPARGMLIAFGGRTASGASGASRASGALWSISLPTLEGRLVSNEPALARHDHGAHFDPLARTLTVYGGAAGDLMRTDAVSFSLHTGAWEVLSPEGFSTAGPLTEAFVRHDRAKGLLWVAGGPATGELAAHELRLASGQWSRRVALSALPPAEPGTHELTFSADSPAWLLMRSDPEITFPGELRLVTLESPASDLGLAAYDHRERLLARSPAAAAEPELLVLGQPGERIFVELEALPGISPDLAVPVTVRDRAAALSPILEVQGYTGTTDLTVMEETQTLYLAHGRHVTAIDLFDPAQPLPLGSLDLGSPVSAVSACGDGLLCAVTKASPYKLVVLDLADPGYPEIAGELVLPGDCPGLAADGPRVFLACGGRGVARVTLSDPSAPGLIDHLDAGGTATAVALYQDLLAVALGSSRKLKVYQLRPGAPASLVAEASTSRQGQRLHVAYPYLHLTQGSPGGWLRCLSGKPCQQTPTEVFVLDEEARSLGLAGSYGTADAVLPLGRTLGRHIIVPREKGFGVLRAEPVP